MCLGLVRRKQPSLHRVTMSSLIRGESWVRLLFIWEGGEGSMMVLFVVVHVLVGLALVYVRHKLPRAMVTFLLVFLGMSVFYFGRLFF